MERHFPAIFLKGAGDTQLALRRYAAVDTYETWERRQINQRRLVAAATATTALLPGAAPLLYVPAAAGSYLYLYRKMAGAAYAKAHDLGADVEAEQDLLVITSAWAMDVRALAGRHAKTAANVAWKAGA